MAIAFRRVGSVGGPTSGIRAEVMGSNPRGVVGAEIVDRSEDWPRPSTPLVLAVDAWVNIL